MEKYRFKTTLCSICFLFFLSDFFWNQCYAQVRNVDTKDLISNEALGKMMIDYFNYTLLGNQTPSTGFKIETNKPSVSIRGNYLHKRARENVFSLELTGGLEDGNLSMFSGGKVNSSFSANFGYYRLFPGNYAKRFKVTEVEAQMTKEAMEKFNLDLSKEIDSFVVIKQFLDNGRHNCADGELYLTSIIRERSKKKYAVRWVSASNDFVRDIDYIRSLVIGMFLSLGAVGSSFSEVYSDLCKKIYSVGVDNILAKRMLNEYDRFHSIIAASPHTLSDRQSDFELKLTEFVWTKKAISWFGVNLGLNGSYIYSLNPIDTSISSSNLFAPTIGVSWNFLAKWLKNSKFFYSKSSINVSRFSNLIELDKFEYSRDSIYKVSQVEQVKSVEKGMAYVGEINSGIGIEVSQEIYYIPWEVDFVPGLYSKLSFRYCDNWLNRAKLAFDLGFLFNLSASGSDAKNLVSLMPYVSWSNLLKEYEDVSKTRSRALSDLFSFGFRLGIPINLPK